MWSRAAVVFTCLITTNYISTHPVNDESENVRLARQLDFGECCPCPGSGGFPIGRSHGVFQNSLPEDIDDCPCRFRSTDSEGASSILFPSATRSFMKQNDNKETPKNLLEPEVDLASSMLETLREVTEEEYQDALARDAAKTRAEEESMLSDATPEESGGNIVTIVVHPSQIEDDDVISDASHVQESRCIHPLARPLGRTRMPSPSDPSNVMNEILRLPKKRPIGLLHRNLLDMDSYGGASNVRERVVDPMEKNPLIKLSQTNLRANDNNDSPCDDLRIASSNMQERFAEKQNPKLRLKSLIPKDIFQEPLKNLLKLKDVELFTPGKARNGLLLPKLDIKPLFNGEGNKALDLNELFKELKINFKKDSIKETDGNAVNTKILDSVPNSSSNVVQNNNNINCLFEDITSKPTETVSSVTQNNDVEILDTIFSPSQNEPILIINDEDKDRVLEQRNDIILFQNENMTLGTQQISNSTKFELISNEESERNVKPLVSETINEQTECPTEENVYQVDNNDSINTKHHLIDFQSDNNPMLKGNDLNVGPKESSTQPLEFVNKDDPQIYKISQLGDSYIEEKDNNESIFQQRTRLPISDETSSKIKEMLKFAQENFKRTFEGIKQKSLVLKPNTFTKIHNDATVSENNQSLSSSNKLNNIVDDSSVEQRKEREQIKGDDLSIDDLQKLSNSLLQLSNQREEPIIKEDQADSQLLKEDNIMYYSSTISNIPKIGELTDTGLSTQNHTPKKEENVCVSNLDSVQKSVNDEYDDKFLLAENSIEMDTGASEPIINTLFNPLTTLKGNNILREVFDPPSFKSLPDVENNNIFNGLPMLDDIANQISTFFESKEDNEDNSSGMITDKAYCPSDDENIESLMSAEPSTLNTQTRVPPLENMNLELFQWKPFNAQPEILKSFRTNLKLPKKLEVRPMTLQSILGKKDSMLGTTMSLIPKQKSNSGLPKNPLFLGEDTNVLRSSIGNILNLDDFTSMLRENAQNLMNKGRELIPSNLEPIQSVDSLTENLKSRAGYALKNIQQSVQSTIKQAEQNTFVGDSLPSPKDLLDKVASAREDLNDKLIGLHHDFNDRLTSLHNNIFDQSRFMSSRIPVLKSGNRGGNKNVQNLRKNKFKPVKLITAESKTEPVLRNPPAWYNDFQKKFDTTQSNAQEKADHSRINAYKLSSNVPVPKSIDVPRLEQTIRKPPLASTHRDSNIKKSISRPFGEEKEAFSTKHHKLLRQEVNPFKDSKFKVTFATTTQLPTTSIVKSRLPTTPSALLRSNIDTGRNGNFLTNRGTSRIPNLKSFDTNMHPSEIQPSRLPALFDDPPAERENEMEAKRSKLLKINHLPIRTLLQPSRHSENSNEINLTSINESEEDNVNTRETIRKPWSAIKWPKKSDDSFLTQVREAVKARKANIESNQVSKINNRPISTTDMIKSASENTDAAVFDNHLKENAIYKCKMICTRE